MAHPIAYLCVRLIPVTEYSEQGAALKDMVGVGANEEKRLYTYVIASLCLALTVFLTSSFVALRLTYVMALMTSFRISKATLLHYRSANPGVLATRQVQVGTMTDVWYRIGTLGCMPASAFERTSLKRLP